VAEEEGFANVVGDEDDGFFQARSEGLEFALKFGASDGIKRAEGLVHKKDRRVSSKGAGDADALALAAGKFVGMALGKVGGIEANQMEKFFDACGDSCLVPFFESGDKGDVLRDREMGKEAGFLNNISNAAAKANGIALGGGAAFDENLAFGRDKHAIYEFEEGGFATSAAAEEDERFASRDT